MRLCFISKTTRINAENYENTLSKLWDEAKVRFVAVCTLYFRFLGKCNRRSETAKLQ